MPSSRESHTPTDTAARPAIYDDAFAEPVAKRLLPRIMEWARGQDEAGALEDLTAALANAVDWDGYELASSLDRYHHWLVDSELVEILENASHYRWDAHRAATAAWVTAGGITLSREVDDIVMIHHAGKTYQGCIIALDHTHAQYTVRVPELGHVDRGSGNGTLGIIVNVEDVP